MKILVTGGAGFIGSALVRYLVDIEHIQVINVDCLTYAGNLDNLSKIRNAELHSFEKVDICDLAALETIYNKYKPDKVIHLAAESHVDRSIYDPYSFINTNIIGTFNLLKCSQNYYDQLRGTSAEDFKFLHVSTDEVFGDLKQDAPAFTEENRYKPNSPYSASKASSDHFVRAWNNTYGLPTLITNCSNNYGPYHYPEKLIPLMITNALRGQELPIYGDGKQIRDWLYVEDHAEALFKVITEGEPSSTFNIGGFNEKTNIEVVHQICDYLDSKKLYKNLGIGSFRDQIKNIKDRPGHDVRYAIDSSKIKNELGWVPKQIFEVGLIKTIEWYLDNKWWWEKLIK